MRRRLPIAALWVLILTADPASAQNVFLDVNGDGRCGLEDALHPGISSVDVWFETDRNADGGSARCVIDPDHHLTMHSYEFTLRAWGGGTVTYGAWIPGPAVAGFQVDLGTASAGTDIHVAFGAMRGLEPGRYRVGSLRLSIAGYPRLSFVTSSGLDREFLTSFGSECPGSDYDATVKLGRDFTDSCGTAPTAAPLATAWRAIRSIYR
jgi:hypothetical protein